MRRILVPTDFSENSWKAIKYGVELLKDRCTFYLLHVNPLSSFSEANDPITVGARLLDETLVHENKRCMDRLIKRIKTLPGIDRHTIMPLIETDYLVDGIKREVQDKHIDLILMGTKGASSQKKMAMGSNTGAVITRVKCPLLAIPENAVYHPLREIAFPTDFQIAYDIRVLDDLIKMVTTHNAFLRILHISKKGEVLSVEQQRNKDLLHDYVSHVPHSFHTLTSVRLEQALQCFVESREIDMVAMVAKNLNYFQRILFRPTVEEISYHTDVPFLVLHE